MQRKRRKHCGVGVLILATKKQCEECVHRKKKDCPILKGMHEKGAKGDGGLRTMCISYKDK